jgi:hypothetical protein
LLFDLEVGCNMFLQNADCQWTTGVISQKTETSMEGKVSNTEVIRNLKGQNKSERRELS